jgi:hypothetical protein
MANLPTLDTVRTLRTLARRAAQGDTIASSDVMALLDALGPLSLDLVYGRALHSIVRTGDLHEAPTRRRLYHAARALAERLEQERVGDFPIPIPLSRAV